MTRARRAAVAAIATALVVALAGCGGKPWPVAGPFLMDGNNPSRPDTHWHAARGVYDCGHWMGDATGEGVWDWPVVTPDGHPGRAANPDLYAGLHSHDDGVIHMEPLVAEEAGAHATLGRYFDYGGWRLSSTGYSFLGTTVKNGDHCGGAPGSLQWAHAKWNGKLEPQKYTLGTGDPASYKLFDADIVMVVFLPAGKSIASIGDPPSLPNLAAALGVSP